MEIAMDTDDVDAVIELIEQGADITIKSKANKEQHGDEFPVEAVFRNGRGR